MNGRARQPWGRGLCLAGVALGLLLWPAGAAAQFVAVNTVGLGDQLTCMTISHQDPNFVLIGTAEGKIRRTTDGGATWQEMVVVPRRDLFYGRERSGDPQAEYALGLPGKSPHLQSWLRRRGLRTSGISMQQVLVEHGDRPVAINWIEVDWHDESRVWVGTPDGLYRSTNGGRTFLRIWQGHNNTSERNVTTVVTDPSDPRRLLVGTAGGLFVSEDRGATFRPEMDFYVQRSYVRALYFDEVYAGLVHMAMGGAAMASPDSGRHWITTHWDLWGPRSSVQWISLGPENLRVMGTRDGVWASWQGGEMGTWVRRGYVFVERTINQTLATQDPNVWYALTDQAVWRTDDAGINWVKVKQTGGRESPIWIQAFRGHPDYMWLLTNKNVYRAGPIPGLQPMANPQPQPAIADIPPLSALWERVMRQKDLHFEDLQRKRNRAPWAALLPDLRAGARHDRALDTYQVRVYPHLHWPYVYYNQLPDRAVTVEVFARWDLGRLVFDRRELPGFGRIDRTLRGIREDLTDRIHTLYSEYRRVSLQLAYSPPADAVVYEALRLRLTEISGLFDSLSDGYWSRHTGGRS